MAERESMDVDVLIVGGGPAGLACAIQLMKSLKEHSEIEEPMVVLIEKGSSVGAHGFSGGIMVPTVLEKLFPDRAQWDFSMKTPVKEDVWSFLTETGRVPLLSPPGHSNKDNLIVSLSQMTSWLGDEAEKLGVNIFPGFAGVELLYDEAGDLKGVRTGDKGIDKEGNKKGNFEPGIDLLSKVTVFAEGPRGTLTKELIKKKDLNKDRKTMVYSTGVKELWEVPEGRAIAGTVEHSMGFPLGKDEFGGGFIYHLENNQVTVGFVTSLDYRDPFTDPHLNLQKYKMHPRVKKLLDGGNMIGYGAKVIPEGGWDSIPEMSGKGFLIVGDSAGFLNLPALKGIHLSMESGILAAESCLQVLIKGEAPAELLSNYNDAVEKSFIGKELKECRNFRQHFDGSFFSGLITAGIDMMTKGKISLGVHKLERDRDTLKTISEYYDKVGKKRPEPFVFDGVLTFDKLTDIYHSGTQHEEEQPAHLKVGDYSVCATKCLEEYGNPCVRFCPAGVYEMEEDGAGGSKLKLNASNCIHCKTCDIKDPYENINWVPPEGEGGPSYGRL